jgi:transposase InsO family protein
MNAYAERFVRSIRREALEPFIIVNDKQLGNIILQFVDYYNALRPHQGIGQRTPCGYTPQASGTVVSKPILSGLHHHYYRIPA